MSNSNQVAWYRFERADSTLNWFEKLEKKRAAIVPALLLVLFAVLAVTSLRLSWSYDIYWHLQMGKDWIENGLSLFRDHYSFTHAGDEIRSPAALFEVGIAYLVDWLGMQTAFKVYKFAALGLTLGLVAWWLRRIRAPVLAYVLVLPVATLLLQLRALERPELIGFALIVLSVILYQRVLDAGRMNVRNMLPIIGLVLFWTNYHGAILAYVIFFGLFIDMAWAYWRERAPVAEWVSWAGWGVIILAAGFVNLNFSHPVLGLLSFDSTWREHIVEYSSPIHLLLMPAIYGVIVLALATVWLLLKQRRFGYLIVSLLFLHQAVFTVRMVGPAGLFVMSVFALALTDMRPGDWVGKAARWKSTIAVAGVWIMVLSTVLTTVSTARHFISSNQHLDSRYPVYMADYLRDLGADERIINEYQLGSYLVQAVDGKLKVYIDGRTNILYPLEHFLRYQEVLEEPEVLREEMEAYDVEFAAFRNHPELALRMHRTGILGLDFVDLRYSLYRRTNPNFPIMGFLWAQPSCWKPSMTQDILDEQLRALINLPQHSPMLPYLALAANYSVATDDAAREEVLRNAELDETVIPRFIGYRALELGAFPLAASAFGSIEDEGYRDMLAAAWANVEVADYERAEEYLDRVTRVKLNEVHPNDLVVLHRLLRDLQDAQALTKFDAAYIDNLGSEVAQLDEARVDEEISAATFCTDSPLVFADADTIE